MGQKTDKMLSPSDFVCSEEDPHLNLPRGAGGRGTSLLYFHQIRQSVSRSLNGHIECYYMDKASGVAL